MKILRIRPALWLILACLLALIPIFIQVYILATTGVDNVSDDYLRFIRLANQVLSPGYNWGGYFRDSFDNNVHSYAFLFLFRLALAQITHLSVLVESYIGLFLSAIKVLILYLLFTRYTSLRSNLRFVLIPVLSLLVFSLSQVSAYSFGETALQMGWTQVGILAGLWLLLLRRDHPLAPTGAALCGVLASYSGGSGILAWPVFLLAILLTDIKNVRKYIAWLIGMGIGLWPYLAYSTYSSAGELQIVLPFLTIRRFLTGLGLPMANNINYAVADSSEAIHSGFVGLVFLAGVCLLFILFRSSGRFRRAIPGFLLVAWGGLDSLQITASRTYFAPWYTSSLMLFWIGLLGLAACLLPFEAEIPAGKFLSRYQNWIWRLAGIGGLLLITVIFILSNHSYEDKSFILTSRSPASAACLRDYLTAPTYCEGLVFQWGVGNPSYLPEMGNILDKLHWSVQAPHQEWTLQGDMVLGNVSMPPSARWVSEDQVAEASWTDYHHLDLLLENGDAVTWHGNLPSNLKNARLFLGLSAVDQGQCAGAAFAIELAGSGGEENVLHFKDLCGRNLSVEQDLLAYAGSSLSIRFTNESSSNQVVRLQFPRLELDLDYSSVGPYTPATPHPSNTDLSASFSPLPPSADFLPAPSSGGWTDQDVIFQATSNRWVTTGPDPFLKYSFPQPMCLKDISGLYLRLAESDSFAKKYFHLVFQAQFAPGTLSTVTYDLPLLSGEDQHAYTLNLDLLNLPVVACITSVEIHPSAVSNTGSDLWFQAAGFAFLPRQK